jgi:N-acyl-D-amino-acid deacylase
MPRSPVVACLVALLIAGCARVARTTPAPATRPTKRTAVDPNHELVIRNGKIVDGAGNGWFYGDLLIRGGVIADVGRVNAKPGADVIDATGLVVAPGFIDVHTHADGDAIGSKCENFIRDGVTTLVVGNCGGSPRDIGEYFRRIEDKGSACNIAALIGHNTVLSATKGEGAGELTPEQMEKAKQIVRQAMQDGAVGFSTGLIYKPGTYSKTEEIIELAKVSGELGGIYATHVRDEGTAILGAIDEALRIGREAKCRVEISHFKLPADVAKKIGGADATLGKVYAARAAGQEVWVDQYPYTASSTSLNTMLPDWVYDKGNDEARKRLDDPEVVKKVIDGMRQNHEVRRGRKSLAYAVIASCRSDASFNGKNMQQVAQLMKFREQNKATGGGDVELLSADPKTLPDVTMEEQYRAVIDLCRRGGASCVFHTMDEQEVIDILSDPIVAVASDSGVRSFGSGVPHPRGYGTNARVLGRYVREKKLIPLEDAVRKMTSLPATAFRLQKHGLLRPGYVADVTIFDAARVVDQATFEKPHAYASGIVTVIVNGVPVLRGGEMTGQLPGWPVHGPARGAQTLDATVAGGR